MYSSQVRYDGAIRFGLVLLFVFGTSGCKEQLHKKTFTFTCGDQTVDVDPIVGVKPTAVYVCDDDTVAWNSHGHDFKVEFKKDSPFSNDEKFFHNKHSKSVGAKSLKELTVFEYKITVDGKEFDPQVIGGGGH